MTDLEIINEIQKIRNKNNVNWMDILRIAFTYAPEETRKIFKRITNDDNLINELSKQLANNDSITIIGPGESVKNLNPPNHTTLSFSGNFQTFQELDFVPDYWTFLDPNTLVYLYEDSKNGNLLESFLQKLKNQTTFLYNSVQTDGKFYEYGFTTFRGNNWVDNEYRNEIFPYVKSLFKNSIEIPCATSNNYFVEIENQVYESHKYYQKHIIINNTNDKFSRFLLPLVFYFFPEKKNIYSIGFGDFNSPRYNCPVGDTNDYESFKESFNEIKPKLSEYLIHSEKKLIFLNPESYFNQL